MRAFEVKKGTVVQVIKEGREWATPNFIERECKKDNLFFLEDIRIDPIGKLGPMPGGVTIGGHYAHLGYYGFERDGYIMLVHSAKVIVH